IPLGGNRKGNARTKINLLIVFAISGLWHGASWNFVIWGLLNALFLIALDPLFGWNKRKIQNLLKNSLLAYLNLLSFFRLGQYHLYSLERKTSALQLLDSKI